MMVATIEECNELWGVIKDNWEREIEAWIGEDRISGEEKEIMMNEKIVKAAVAYTASLRESNFAFCYLLDSIKSRGFQIVINVSTVLCILAAYGGYGDLQNKEDCAQNAEEKLKLLIQYETTIHFEKDEEKMMDNFKIHNFISQLQSKSKIIAAS